jgi:Right handed beta helix region
MTTNRPTDATRRSRRGFGIAALALAASLLALAPSALAETYAPNKTGDHAVNGCTPSDCTVREAVSAANADGGADTIVLKAGKAYGVTLNPANVEDANAAADLDVNADLTIKASGRGRAALDAHDLNRVLDVGPIAGVNVTLRNVWVRNGFSSEGAGIRAGGGDPDHLALIHGRVTGSATVPGSDGDGGGIKIEGPSTTLNVVRSTISGNRSSGQGGGIDAVDSGVIRVTASTISGNTAGYDGTEQSQGGGIYLINNATLLRLTNSTVANNRATGAGGGISAYNAGVILKSATIARNHADTDHIDNDTGGGIRLGNAANAQVLNTILALNTAFGIGFDDCSELASSVDPRGRNLFSATPSGCLDFASAPNIVQANPHLGKLGSNGGPTKTLPLLKGSKAINRASAAAPPRDQRAVKRHNPDIGAFERG